MRCPSCDVEVSPHQRFCSECGAPLTPTSAVDPALATQQIEAQAAPNESDDDSKTADESEAGKGGAEREVGADDPVPATAIDADLDTQPIHTQPLDTQPVPPTAIDADLDTQPLDAQPGADVADLGGHDIDEHGIEDQPSAVAADELVTEPIERLPPPSWVDATPTTPLVVGTYVDDVVITRTEEIPALFDGSPDLTDYPAPRQPFRLRVSFLLSLFAAVAMVMATVADVIDIRTTRPASGIGTGTRTLEDLGSNLGLAGFIGVSVMVLGALASCFGLRWAAGLAAGAGLAVVGWAGVVIGLAELPIAVAESITRTSSESFTLRVTRDLGWWLAVVVGIIGLLVFVAALRLIGSGGHRALNPIIAAVTALAAVVLAVGPLVPVGTAVFADNFRSTDPERDLPTAFFAGRLGQVALIAFAGVAGMLIVRSFGLGFAAGGVSVATWMWASSLAELGSNPVGIAVSNPGSASTVPHAVTNVGMVATLTCLLVAAIMATWRLNRRVEPQ